MMDLQAALGLGQLRRVESNWKKRDLVWRQYMRAFSDLPVGLPASVDAVDSRHAFHLFTVQIDEKAVGLSRDQFLNAMNLRGIGTGVHYLSLAEHPVYQEKYGWQAEGWPNSMMVGRRTVSLPISAKMNDVEIERVIDTVKSVLP